MNSSEHDGGVETDWKRYFVVEQSGGDGLDAMEEEPRWLGEHVVARSGVTEHKTGEGLDSKPRGGRDRRAGELRWRFVKPEPLKRKKKIGVAEDKLLDVFILQCIFFPF
ncbi:Uncharacterized protein Rs2_10386 [Raphanus sativus]|nr:Uncharacterized protein Rs2_10386 [Raphanus sativus]